MIIGHTYTGMHIPGIYAEYHDDLKYFINPFNGIYTGHTAQQIAILNQMRFFQ